MDIPDKKRCFGLHHLGLTRRQALTAVLAACAYLAGCAQAKTAPTLMLGTIESTLLSDGRLVVPAPMLATNAEQGLLYELIGSTATFVEPPCKAALVRTSQDLVLIYVGAGAIAVRSLAPRRPCKGDLLLWHTEGHIAIEIAEGARGALVVGDALSHPVISFAHPEWTQAADHHNRDQAVATRKALLARLAAEQSTIIGYLLPFPGNGTVMRIGTVYRFEAAA